MKLNKFFYTSLLLFFVSSCGESEESPVSDSEGNTSSPEALFTLLSESESGFYFLNEVNQTEDVNVLAYENFFNGGGVGIGDINNDGLPDIFMTGNLFGGRLYLNKGNLTFEQISETANIFVGGFTTDVSFVDVNNDGYQDIYLCRSLSEKSEDRKNILYVNNKNNTFTNMAESYGIADAGYSNQSTFFDYDNDGDLDLFVMNHRKDFENAQTIYKSGNAKGNILPSNPFWNEASADKLYRNNGDNTFTDVTTASTIINNDFSLSTLATDLNNDGLIDLYISNDFVSKDHAYINKGKGVFKDEIESMFAHIPRSAMGSDAADFNNDGLIDIFNVDMTPQDNFRQKQLSPAGTFDSQKLAEEYGFHRQLSRNMLQLNNGDGTYSEIGQLANVAYTDWSWSPLFADFDNDGWQDLFISNGHYKDITDLDYLKYRSVEEVDRAGGLDHVKKIDLINLMTSTKIHNYAYRNNQSLQFEEQTSEWGLDKLSHSNGCVYADLDLDGDLELVINNFNQEAFLYKNNAREQGKGNYLSISLAGDKGNLDGFGTKVSITTKNGVQIRECSPYRGFLSSNDVAIHFGLGDVSIIDKLEVTWPNGKSQTMNNVKANQQLTLTITNANETKATSPKTTPLFTKVNGLTNFKHQENGYNDFKQEPLLEHFLSNKGPIMETADLNNDGLADVYLGGSSGFPGTLLIQNKNGSFTSKNSAAFTADKSFEDGGCTFIDLNGDGALDLYVSSGSNEFSEGDNLQDRMYLNDGRGNFSRSKESIPNINTSSSCVTPIDFDKDGDLDLFIGGFAKKNAYPLFHKSWLLQNDSGTFSDASHLLPENGELGIITDAAVFSDDKLMIVGEWMEITILQKKANGSFEKAKDNGLENSGGWWNTIEASDFDNDGDLDFVVGNRGKNSMFKASSEHPAKICFGDFDSNQDLDAIPCYYNPVEKGYFPKYGLDRMFMQMKGIRKIFPDYISYSRASLDKIIPSTNESRYAHTSASMYIENLGNGKMVLKELPIQAQFSYVQGILCKDINNDGQKDIILVGNNFGVDIEAGKSDASQGLILINKAGEFKALSTHKSCFSTGGLDARKIVSVSDDLILVSTNNGPLLTYKKK